MFSGAKWFARVGANWPRTDYPLVMINPLVIRPDVSKSDRKLFVAGFESMRIQVPFVSPQTYIVPEMYVCARRMLVANCFYV